MQQASLEAYQLITPVLPECRYKVYEIILENGPATNKEIALLLDWPINKVTPRSNWSIFQLEKLKKAPDSGLK